MLNPFLFDNPTQAYGINAGYAGQMNNNNAMLQANAMDANAAMQRGYMDNLAQLLGIQYQGNTNYNIADLQNQGANYRNDSGLKNNLDLANLNNATSKDIAGMQTGAQRYGYDQSLAGQQYTADASKENTLVSALANAFGSQQAADASKYGSQAGLLGQRYSADAQQNIAGGNNMTNLGVAQIQSNAQMAPTQASVYKFNTILPMFRDLFTSVMNRRNGVA